MQQTQDTAADEIVREHTNAANPCPRCGSKGSVDFFDLVRGHASMHCPVCPTAWTVQIDAPLSHLVRPGRD